MRTPPDYREPLVEPPDQAVLELACFTWNIITEPTVRICTSLGVVQLPGGRAIGRRDEAHPAPFP